MNNELTQEDLIGLVTSENVRLSLQPAGIGSRGMAQVIDLLIQVGAIFVILLLLFIYGYELDYFPDSRIIDLSKGVVIAVGILVYFVTIWGYHVFFELVWNGQTPGKKWAGIRVVAAGGRPLTIYESGLRNIVRIVDFLPNIYAVGTVTMFLNKEARRLGDIVAGTYVVKVVDDRLIVPYKSRFGKGKLPPDTQQYIKQKADDMNMEKANLVREYLERRRQLNTDVRYNIGRRLVDRLLGLTIIGRKNLDTIDRLLDALLISFNEKVS